MANGEQQRAKAVFSRCLLGCPSVRLWTTYLRFIKQVGRVYLSECSCVWRQEAIAGHTFTSICSFAGLSLPVQGGALYIVLVSF